MVKVYMESNSHADLVALFATEEMYEVCAATLEQLAKENNMIVTESVTEQELESIDLYTITYEDKYGHYCDYHGTESEVKEREVELKKGIEEGYIESVGNVAAIEIPLVKEKLVEWLNKRYGEL